MSEPKDLTAEGAEERNHNFHLRELCALCGYQFFPAS